jgi:hypothetical protein
VRTFNNVHIGFRRLIASGRWPGSSSYQRSCRRVLAVAVLFYFAVACISSRIVVLSLFIVTF